MSMSFGNKVSFDIRHINLVLERMGLPKPVQDGDFYVADAKMVRTWVQRAENIEKRLQDGGSIGLVQTRFVVFMEMISQAAEDHAVQKMDQPVPAYHGVRDDFEAVWV